MRRGAEAGSHTDRNRRNDPLPQQQSAKTAVHVNRVLRELREEGLVTFQHGHVEIHDLNALMELADFDKAYLDHDSPLLK